MEFAEFNHEMERLESCWPTNLDAAKLAARREVLWERVESLNVRVFRAARNSLIDAGPEFLPSVPEILEACWEAERLGRPRNIASRALHSAAPHRCGPPAVSSRALTELQIGFPYEAVHIACPGPIPATCPTCGRRRLEEGVFDALVSRYPSNETNDWNPCFKGLLLCAKCEAR